jgi:hypothetical protein
LATFAAVYTVPPTTTPGNVTPAGKLAVSGGTAAAMACIISLTADMAGEGTEWRSPTRQPFCKSTTAALIDEPPISIPIACRCIPR